MKAVLTIALILAVAACAFYVGMTRSLCAHWEQYTAAERAAMELTADECGITYHD